LYVRTWLDAGTVDLLIEFRSRGRNCFAEDTILAVQKYLSGLELAAHLTAKLC
jgi:hypothetical protein